MEVVLPYLFIGINLASHEYPKVDVSNTGIQKLTPEKAIYLK